MNLFECSCPACNITAIVVRSQAGGYAHMRASAGATADMRPGNTASASPGLSVTSRSTVVPKRQTIESCFAAITYHTHTFCTFTYQAYIDKNKKKTWYRPALIRSTTKWYTLVLDKVWTEKERFMSHFVRTLTEQLWTFIIVNTPSFDPVVSDVLLTRLSLFGPRLFFPHAYAIVQSQTVFFICYNWGWELLQNHWIEFDWLIGCFVLLTASYSLYKSKNKSIKVWKQTSQ